MDQSTQSTFYSIIKKDPKERTGDELNVLVDIITFSDYNFIRKHSEDLEEDVDSEFLYGVCKNAKLRTFIEEDTIFDSEMKDVELIVISGSASLYKAEQIKDDQGKKRNVMTFLRILQEWDEFGYTESEAMISNEESINQLILISNNNCDICFFKFNSDYVYKESDDLAGFESQEIKEIKLNTLKKTSPSKIKIAAQEQAQKSYVTFDPEIFLIDNPEKLNEVIESVKDKIDTEFSIFDKYAEIINNFSHEKEVTELFSDKILINTLDASSINALVDSKFKNFTDDSRLEIKMALLINKSLNQIEKCNEDIKNDLDGLKTKLYSTTNIKNKNLMMMSVEEEIKKEEFKMHIIDKINKEGKLNSLLEGKKKNEEVINKNKLKIKKDENYLLDTFYCVKCHIRPRNVISKNCHHLMFCDECIEKNKVCPRCGIDIEKFDKIYRS